MKCILHSKGRENIFFFKMYGILIGMFIYCSQYCIVKVHAKIWILRADAKNQYDRNAKSSVFLEKKIDNNLNYFLDIFIDQNIHIMENGICIKHGEREYEVKETQLRIKE